MLAVDDNAPDVTVSLACLGANAILDAFSGRVSVHVVPLQMLVLCRLASVVGPSKCCRCGNAATKVGLASCCYLAWWSSLIHRA